MSNAFQQLNAPRARAALQGVARLAAIPAVLGSVSVGIALRVVRASRRLDGEAWVFTDGAVGDEELVHSGALAPIFVEASAVVD